jgi:hypothetical protein
MIPLVLNAHVCVYNLTELFNVKQPLFRFLRQLRGNDRKNVGRVIDRHRVGMEDWRRGRHSSVWPSVKPDSGRSGRVVAIK